MSSSSWFLSEKPHSLEKRLVESESEDKVSIVDTIGDDQKLCWQFQRQRSTAPCTKKHQQNKPFKTGAWQIRWPEQTNL